MPKDKVGELATITCSRQHNLSSLYCSSHGGGGGNSTFVRLECHMVWGPFAC